MIEKEHEYRPLTMKAALQEAIKRDCRVVHYESGDGTEMLTLDLDGPACIQTFQSNLDLVLRSLVDDLQVLVIKWEAWKSRSHRGAHVILTLDAKIDIAEALVLQAALGSDIRREFCCLMRKLRQDNGESMGFGNDPRTLFQPTRAKVESTRVDVLRMLSALENSIPKAERDE